MLVLNRKKNQKILIGRSIEVEIVKIGQNRVELGIKAPHDIEIVRDDVKKEKAGCLKSESKSLLDQAVEIILNLKTGSYTKAQTQGAAEVVEAILRRHYAGGGTC